MTVPYIIFQLENKKYATNALNVVEIIKHSEPETFETMPEGTLGVMSFRGSVINIFDIKAKLGLESVARADKTLVISINNSISGIFADKVEDVIHVEQNEIEAMPYESEDSLSEGLLRVKNDLISILDFAKIFKNSPSRKTTMAISANSYELAKNDSYALKIPEKDNSFISFKLGGNLYCINFNYIKEFSELMFHEITQVPQTPEYLKGVVNLRGEFISIFDIKEFLNIPKTENSNKTKAIIISAHELKIGICVDELCDIINIPQEKLNTQKAIKSDKNNLSQFEMVLENQKVITVLDIENLLKDDRIYIDIA